ncbi:polymer-forming cytoskeletal protein [bacterium]
MLFGNNEPTEQKKTLPKVETIIGLDTSLMGDIRMESGTIRIDGKIESGSVTSEGIIVGEKGIVKGDVKARIIIIAGNVEGDVYATERLEILPEAKVLGDVYTVSLSIAEGSVFEGNCKMLREETQEQPSVREVDTSEKTTSSSQINPKSKIF